MRGHGAEEPRTDPGQPGALWLAGLFAGAFGFLMFGTIGPLGAVPGLLAVMLLLIARPWLAAVSGALIGIGACWLLLAGPIAAACVDCERVTLLPALAVAAALVIAGVLVGLVVRRRVRRGVGEVPNRS